MALRLRPRPYPLWLLLASVLPWGGPSAEPAEAASSFAAPVQEGDSARTKARLEAEEAISKLRSPYCPGLMLEVCPTPEARALRDSIHATALQGADAGALLEGVVAQLGEEYRAYPKRSGPGLVAWIAPPLALLLGAGLVVFFLSRGRRSSGAPPPRVTPEEERRISRALKRLEQSEAG